MRQACPSPISTEQGAPAMNIFICWSGDRSKRLANALQTYLPQFIPVFQSAPDKNSLFVSDDITKGSRWFDEVERQLDVADAGLVCITREALQSGWIHFEAGALARAVRKNATKARAHGGTLYTYLLGVQPDELTGPLAEYQSTRFDREDTKRLCAAIVAGMKAYAAVDEGRQFISGRPLRRAAGAARCVHDEHGRAAPRGEEVHPRRRERQTL